jgi:NTP pyrophosphatase (non-canonical NTP hydrolase)
MTTHDIYDEATMTDPNMTHPSPAYADLDHAVVSEVFDTLAGEINHIAREKGFWSEALDEDGVLEDVLGAHRAAELRNREQIAGEETSVAISELRELVRRARETTERNEPEMIALEVSELGEALEGIRHGNPPSDKIPAFSQAEEELADCLIRIFDHGLGKGYRLADAMIAKIEYNRTRPYKHGKTC